MHSCDCLDVVCTSSVSCCDAALSALLLFFLFFYAECLISVLKTESLLELSCHYVEGVGHFLQSVFIIVVLRWMQADKCVCVQYNQIGS